MLVNVKRHEFEAVAFGIFLGGGVVVAFDGEAADLGSVSIGIGIITEGILVDLCYA